MKIKNLQDVNETMGEYAKKNAELALVELAHEKAIAKVDKTFANKSKMLSKIVETLKIAIENFIITNKDRLFNPTNRSMKLPNGTIGIRGGNPPLKIADEDKTIMLIRKYFPDREALAIRKYEEPAKAVLQDWSDADLLKVGVTRDNKTGKPWFEPNKNQLAKRARNANK